ncbi:MAG: type 4a pilus biogenesis protein PilO, partial [Candidatus Saganbacteria bacterium]|nr:type 4a pilus biogenesis protein PilO [Candidatus Saganbacteria bacterium]
MGTPLWQKILIISIIVVLAVYGAYNYIYKPKITQIDSLKKTLNMIDLELKMIVPEEMVQLRGETLKNIIKAELQEFMTKIPTEGEVPFIIEKFISEVGKGLNIDYNLIQPQPVIAEDKYKRLPLKVDFVSDYTDLNMYFSKLKSLPSTIRIDELELARTGEQPKLKVHMLLSAFVMPGKPVEKAEEYQRKHYVYDPFFKHEESAVIAKTAVKQALILQGI